jgi:hypothetical protein
MLSVVFISGCMSTMGPKMPREMTSPSITSYSKSEFDRDVKAYRCAMGTPVEEDKQTCTTTVPDLPRALALRNQIAYRVMADIESSYSKFEMSLTSRRATQGTLSDMTVLGMTAATGLVGVGDVKDILAATSLAFQGSSQSYDKNFFREKTTESLVSQMRATRKTLQAQLIKSLETRNDVTTYPWDAVWIDLVDFYYAGTVPSALVEIASSTGASADEATVKLSDAVASLTPCTPIQAKQLISIRSEYTKLEAAVNSADNTVSESAATSLKAILTAAGITPNASGKATDLLAQFHQALTGANCGEKLKALNMAVSNMAF